MKTLSSPNDVRQALAALKHGLHALYGPRLAGLYLYGSQARGTAQPDSDVDILIVLHGEVNAAREVERVNELVSDVALEHHLLISTLAVGSDAYTRGEGMFLKSVKDDAVAV